MTHLVRASKFNTAEICDLYNSIKKYICLPKIFVLFNKLKYQKMIFAQFVKLFHTCEHVQRLRFSYINTNIERQKNITSSCGDFFFF